MTPATAKGLRRFAADLPAVDEIVSLGEGDTPLLSLDGLAKRAGLRRLSVKMESQNPTGSYKDRVAAMSVSLARQQDKRGWIATSSGNAGLAMAAYGTRAFLPGFLCVLASAPPEKRLPLTPYSVRVVAIEGLGGESGTGTVAELMALVRAASERYGLFLGITAHAFNYEGMRGIDTISYELAEQVPSATHVYVPTGGGGLLAAIARGLRHRALGAKVITCQPSGCAPIAQFVNGLIPTPAVERCDSEISALQLPDPPDGRLAADAVWESGGWGTAVDDDAIIAAQHLLAETEGIFVEPASAAAVAGLLADVEQGRLDPGAHPVLILTGAGWKDLGRFAREAPRPPVVELDAVPELVDRWMATLDRTVVGGTQPGAHEL